MTPALARPEISKSPRLELSRRSTCRAFQIFSLLYAAVSCLSLDPEWNCVCVWGVRQVADRATSPSSTGEPTVVVYIFSAVTTGLISPLP